MIVIRVQILSKKQLCCKRGNELSRMNDICVWWENIYSLRDLKCETFLTKCFKLENFTISKMTEMIDDI